MSTFCSRARRFHKTAVNPNPAASQMFMGRGNHGTVYVNAVQTKDKLVRLSYSALYETVQNQNSRKTPMDHAIRQVNRYGSIMPAASTRPCEITLRQLSLRFHSL